MTASSHEIVKWMRTTFSLGCRPVWATAKHVRRGVGMNHGERIRNGLFAVAICAEASPQATEERSPRDGGDGMGATSAAEPANAPVVAGCEAGVASSVVGDMELLPSPASSSTALPHAVLGSTTQLATSPTAAAVRGLGAPPSSSTPPPSGMEEQRATAAPLPVPVSLAPAPAPVAPAPAPGPSHDASSRGDGAGRVVNGSGTHPHPQPEPPQQLHDASSAFHRAAIAESAAGGSGAVMGVMVDTVGHHGSKGSSSSGAGASRRLWRGSDHAPSGSPHADHDACAFLLVEASHDMPPELVASQLGVLVQTALVSSSAASARSSAGWSACGWSRADELVGQLVPLDNPGDVASEGMTAWVAPLLTAAAARAGEALHRDRDHRHSLGGSYWLTVLSFTTSSPPAFVLQPTALTILHLAQYLLHSVQGSSSSGGETSRLSLDAEDALHRALDHMRIATPHSVGKSARELTNPLLRGLALRREVTSPPPLRFVRELSGHFAEVADVLRQADAESVMAIPVPVSAAGRGSPAPQGTWSPLVLPSKLGPHIEMGAIGGGSHWSDIDVTPAKPPHAHAQPRWQQPSPVAAPAAAPSVLAISGAGMPPTGGGTALRGGGGGDAAPAPSSPALGGSGSSDSHINPELLKHVSSARCFSAPSPPYRPAAFPATRPPRATRPQMLPGPFKEGVMIGAGTSGEVVKCACLGPMCAFSHGAGPHPGPCCPPCVCSRAQRHPRGHQDAESDDGGEPSGCLRLSERVPGHDAPAPRSRAARPGVLPVQGQEAGAGHALHALQPGPHHRPLAGVRPRHPGGGAAGVDGAVGQGAGVPARSQPGAQRREAQQRVVDGGGDTATVGPRQRAQEGGGGQHPERPACHLQGHAQLDRCVCRGGGVGGGWKRVTTSPPVPQCADPSLLAERETMDACHAGRSSDVYTFGLMAFHIVAQLLPWGEYGKTGHTVMKLWHDGRMPASDAGGLATFRSVCAEATLPGLTQPVLTGSQVDVLVQLLQGCWTNVPDRVPMSRVAEHWLAGSDLSDPRVQRMVLAIWVREYRAACERHDAPPDPLRAGGGAGAMPPAFNPSASPAAPLLRVGSGSAPTAMAEWRTGEMIPSGGHVSVVADGDDRGSGVASHAMAVPAAAATGSGSVWGGGGGVGSHNPRPPVTAVRR